MIRFLRSGLLTLAAAMLISCNSTSNTPKPDAQGFVPLFNGKDLNNWVDINGHDDTWKVEDGIIKCTGKPICMLRTDRMYENFILELEWNHRTPKANAGVFVWTDGITAPGQPFLKGIEIQVMVGMQGSWYTSDGDVFPTHGATMKPAYPRGSGSRSYPQVKAMKPYNNWNKYKLTCIDGVLTLEVNGKHVNKALECNPRKGYIALESEGGPIDFRNIRIKELPPSKNLPADQIAKPQTGYQNLYTSKSLKQWQITDAQKQHWTTSDWIINHTGKGGILWHGKQYDNFTLVTDFKFVGKDLNKQAEKLAALILKSEKQSAQVILKSKGLSGALRYTTNPTPVNATQNGDKKAGAWNRLEITRSAENLTIKVNGKTVNTSTNFQALDPAKIGLFSTSKMQFANVMIKPLD